MRRGLFERKRGALSRVIGSAHVEGSETRVHDDDRHDDEDGTTGMVCAVCGNDASDEEEKKSLRDAAKELRAKVMARALAFIYTLLNARATVDKNRYAIY